MMRLVDADELKHRMETVEMFGLKGLMKVAIGMVTESPTVDAVEVVRCKDCTSFYSGWCCDYGIHMDDNEFCSWGERRTDETD